MTYWSPDSCGCVLKLDFPEGMPWENATEEQITAMNVCEHHQAMEPLAHFQQVYLGENKPRNDLVLHIQNTFPGGVSADSSIFSTSALAVDVIDNARAFGDAPPHLSKGASLLVPTNIDEHIATMANLPISPLAQQLLSMWVAEMHQKLLDAQLQAIKNTVTFDENRKLRCDAPGLNDADKEQIQADVEKMFGAGKVVVG
jgi:hypothetical protein